MDDSADFGAPEPTSTQTRPWWQTARRGQDAIDGLAEATVLVSTVPRDPFAPSDGVVPANSAIVAHPA
ncbi:MAG: hypothetical protein ABIR32_06765 [Ilumatobacteraceae bacterium]